MFGAPDNEHAEAESFFNTDTIDSALDLMNQLRKMAYVVECVNRRAAAESL